MIMQRRISHLPRRYKRQDATYNQKKCLHGFERVYTFRCSPFKDEEQTALFKDPVRTAQ